MAAMAAHWRRRSRERSWKPRRIWALYPRCRRPRSRFRRDEKMSLSDLVEKLGKTIFEAPFDAALAPKDSPELAEIRITVIEQILKNGQRVGGKIIFPHNLVRIHVRGASDNESAFLRSEFL